MVISGKNLSQITVKDMVKNREVFYSVSMDDTVKEAASTLKRLKIRATGVLKDEKLVGVFSHYDVSTKVVTEGKDPNATKVKDVMTPDVIKVNLRNTFSECLEIFGQHNISHLVVEDKNGNYYGVLSQKDMQDKMLETLKDMLEITQQYAFGPHPSGED
ncbi:CBS domain-containing protein [Candidatus Mycalebacterium sp.]